MKKIIILLYIFISINYAYSATVPLDSIAAVVEDDVITQNELSRRLDEVRKELTERSLPLPTYDKLRERTLERLILEKIQLKIARDAGINIDDDELNLAIEDIAKRNKMSVASFIAAIEQDGYTFNEARNKIKEQILLSRIRQENVASRIQINRKELERFLVEHKDQLTIPEEYRLSSMLIPLPTNPTQEIFYQVAQQTSDIVDRLKAGADFARLAISYSSDSYTMQGGDMGFRPKESLPPALLKLVSKLKIGQITEPIQTPTGFLIIKLTNKRGGNSPFMRREVNARHILIRPQNPTQELQSMQAANMIYNRLQQGEDFATLAKEYSNDPGSKNQGGELGWNIPDIYVGEFKQAIEQQSVGSISKPFTTAFGVHIVEVLGWRNTDGSSKIKEEQALEMLQAQKFDEELQLWLQQIRSEAYVEIR